MGDREKNPNWNPRMRNNGNPHSRGDKREAGRVGFGRDNVIPSQGGSVPSPRFFGAKYKLGSAIRPNSILFDNGFLDKFSTRKPTVSDYASLAKWRLKVAAADTLRPDLGEACKAYRHFLDGRGMDYNFSYDQYVLNDKSGRITLANAMLDIQDGVEMIWEADKSNLKFSMTGGQISCGSSTLFPYPATENWQKAIGGHIIWLSGEVKVTDKNGEIWFDLSMKVHAEDRYNFNPGQKDIATGIPDSDNGIFEITGLGKQFTQKSTLSRVIRWKHGSLSSGVTSHVSAR